MEPAIDRIALLEAENARLREGLTLPGWTCPPPCGAFNGTAKDPLTECRACGASRVKEIVRGAVRYADALIVEAIKETEK